MKITRKMGQQREVLIRAVGPGDILGSNSVLTGSRRLGTATTLSDSVLYEISAEAFLQISRSGEEASEWLMQSLTRRLTEMEHRIEILAGCRVEQRVMILLHALGLTARRPSTSDDVTVPLTQMDLASLVGATRETTSAALRQLREDGLVVPGHACIRIPSLRRLAESAKGQAILQC